MLADSLGLQFKDLQPRSPTLRPDELPTAIRVAKQSLVVALTCFVRAGRLRKVVRVNDLFDELAARWSRHFKDARKTSGARTIRDMLPSTVQGAVRDLLRMGVQFEALWGIATGHGRWKRIQQLLYKPKLIDGYGYQIIIPMDEPEKLADFEAIVGESLDSRSGRRLLLDGASTPRQRNTCKIAGERPFNVVEAGPRAEQVRKTQENTRLRFNVKAFLADYERAQRTVRALTTFLPTKWQDLLELSPIERRHHVTGRRLPSARDIETRKRIRSKRKRRAVRALFPSYDSARRIVTDFKKVKHQLTRLLASGTPLVDNQYFVIKSAFELQMSHRYQWRHFWPPSVSAQRDQQHDEVYQFEISWSQDARSPSGPTVLVDDRREIMTSPRARWFDFLEVVEDGDPYEHHRLIGLDISSSQTQILALLLGIDGLEAEAASRSFKKYLAAEAWRRHKDPKDPFTLNGGTEYVRAYDGPKDDRLVELVKKLWLRRLYGGAVDRTVRDQRKERPTFGPGWTKANAVEFLDKIPWYREIERFLLACQKISKHVDQHEGALFIDPLDGTPIRWHHIQRTEKRISAGDLKLLVSMPGRAGVPATAKQNGKYAGDYPVNRAKLRRVLAPCITPMDDAFYSSLIIERFAARGIQNFVAVHDCWLLPTEDFTDIRDGAAKKWFRGLGPIYEGLIKYLGKDKQFNGDVRRWQVRWRRRVRECERGRRPWPSFRVSDASPLTITEGGRPLHNPAI